MMKPILTVMLAGLVAVPGALGAEKRIWAKSFLK